MVAPMDYLRPDKCAAGRSPRRELQGPRPTPLKVRKDSHKIRKPPPAPAPATQHAKPPPPPPVIIYTVSPKIIHANPSEFMALVQRLTGPDSSTSTSSSSVAAPPPPSAPFHHSFNGSDAIIPPAAPSDRPGYFLADLTANPASLQPNPIPSSNFFSPPSDHQNLLGFFPDLSPLVHSNKNNNLETSLMMASPSPFFISPRIISPGTSSLDLLSNLFDLQHYS